MPLAQLGALSPEEGARTSIYLASSPEVEGVSGKYFTKETGGRIQPGVLRRAKRPPAVGIPAWSWPPVKLEVALPTETVQLDWISDQTFLLRDRAGFPVIMTQPMGVNGGDLLPLSLIGCAAWDLIAIFKKQRLQVSGLQVFAESERDAEPPWRFRKIHVRYVLTGTDLNRAKVQRAIELSETKYCSIHATLREAVELSSEFEIREEHE